MSLTNRIAAGILHIAMRTAVAKNSPAVGLVAVPDSMLARPPRQVDAETLPLLPRAVNSGRYVPRMSTARLDAPNVSAPQGVGL